MFRRPLGQSRGSACQSGLWASDDQTESYCIYRKASYSIKTVATYIRQPEDPLLSKFLIGTFVASLASPEKRCKALLQKTVVVIKETLRSEWDHLLTILVDSIALCQIELAFALGLGRSISEIYS